MHYLILGGGVNISLRLLKHSIKRTRSEGIDGAGFNNIEDFLNKRFREISQLMFRQLKKHQNELSEPSEIIDIFFDSRKTFEEHLSHIWKTKDVIQILFMMDLALLPVKQNIKYSFFNYKY